LRLWVASSDYSGELSISDEILKRVTESYRRIRNTLRFLLANTSDFDYTTEAVAISDLLEIDRYAIANTAALQADILQHYQAFEFHPVIAKLQSFCSEDLGGFYLDILKDRLYTSGTKSHARRSAQTAIWHITQSLLRLMAPTLSFTAEEAWASFSSKTAYQESDETIFTQLFYSLPEITDGAALLQKYATLREIRTEVTKQLEEVRVAGGIGASLQAEVLLKVNAEKYQVLSSFENDLKFAFITSAANVEQVASAEEEAVVVTPSSYTKCERCWHYAADVASHPEHPGLCGRCVSNLFGSGEKRRFA